MTNERRRLIAWVGLPMAVALVAIATLRPASEAVANSATVWCLTCSPIWLADAISNVILFLPLGVVTGVLGLRTSRAVLIGAGFSLGIELLQLSGVPSGRSASLADWITNSAGVFLGAWLVHQRAWLFHPTPQAARGLFAGWTVAIVAMWWAMDWALRPLAVNANVSSPVALSPLPFTPGYGWFAGVAEGASVNGVPLVHGGTGPVIAITPHVDTVRATVSVRGRDGRDDVVPIVFVHARGDTVAYLLLAQRARSALLGTTRNSGRAGLTSPTVALRDVFAPSARAPEAVVILSATVTRRALNLTARERDGSLRSTRLLLSPLVGWSLVQSVVRVDAPLAPVMTALWILVWMIPWGYWLFRTTRAPHR
ncbi:MAG: VanZ family protein [Gemmatimonadaceae bacterium]|nr:VanZ family protein [Gemmatimonadaceae bacterium]